MQEKLDNWKEGGVKHWFLFVLGFIGVLAYSTLSILRHHHFESGGYDLGIFDQAIWHYSRFQVPASTTVTLKTRLAK